MKKGLLILFLGGLFLPWNCKQDNRQPPGREEVFAIRDSLRNELLLRIGRAQQEINRQAEAMKNRAFDADQATARRLNQKARTVETAYEKLERQAQILVADSLMGDWSILEQETELLINEVSRELKTPF
ncbi:MAG: hypothetical protein KDD06_17685 [Phaeodactylibacter sp.]|nr:hypothetical protein [Phaeodactylibacter sp.]MCB9265889.1 hypothetical protein [Lewinellaceae bacterium]MCB9288695.1 hypothetical protein [Lewinellaceae bacterium]